MRPSKTYTTLIALLGEAQALKLIGKYGGTPIYIPKINNMTEDHDLVLLLGWSCAKILSRFYDGDKLDVPLGRNIQIKARNELIYKAYKDGKKSNKIAIKHGLCVRTVNKAIAKLNEKPGHEEPNKNQMDLFLS